METATLPTTPSRSATARSNTSRPKSERAAPRPKKATSAGLSSEPPKKKLRYIPGGPGGGGRYVDEDGTEIPVGGTGPGGYNYIGPRGRIGRENLANGVQPVVYPRRDSRRERSTRTQTVLPRAQQPPMRFASAAQAAAAVQSDGYKPREERGYEEFHPDLDLNSPFFAFSADEVDGITPAPAPAPASADGSVDDTHGAHTVNGTEGSTTRSEGNTTPTSSANRSPLLTMGIPGTPGGGKRRPGRPPKDPLTFWANRAAQQGKTLSTSAPPTPSVIPPIQNAYPKEKLVLPQPSYRVSNTLARFEDKSLGLVRYVDKSMANVGYQESDRFVRPEQTYIRASDAYLDEEMDHGSGDAIGGGGVGRVEYDMDDQDDFWLKAYNEHRKASSTEGITPEMFEITITKIEKEWHTLEKRIPKPNPKPPQTHRPRSSSAAAVNGEPQVGEEQDSKCVICDDGDCENTNAIVFCDGCDLAVHQECYGVPFIPEGQWLCRRCQLAGRGIPTCIFCPNIDGAFKQTNASKWAHLLCAMWIPEVSLGNHTFMEPVMEVEKVPKTRWKLTCYLCNQRMGACIQCGNKACYQAFHVTCARKARLFLKMKNSHGTLAVLDGTTILKAFCDKHCPADYSKENNVAEATRQARAFYKKTMRGRLWADSQASALAMAATHRHAVTEHQPDESQLTGASVEMSLSESKKKGNQPPQTIWKLPSGAPVIPKIVYDSIETSLQRFGVRKRKEFVADACRYWTLKREARRGAPLLKRLQLQMETFSSTEITRRNFPGMGPSGREKLARRIEFAKVLVDDLEKLKSLSGDVVERERIKLELALVEDEIIDTVYFPIAKLLSPIVEKALVLDIKNIFTEGLGKIRARLKEIFYTTTAPFVQDLGVVFSVGISTGPPAQPEVDVHNTSPSKKPAVDIKERRKLAKRIIKAVQPQLEAALRAEADISGISFEKELKKIEHLWEACLEVEAGPQRDTEGDVTMAEGGHANHNGVDHTNGDFGSENQDEDLVNSLVPGDVDMEDVDAPHDEDDIIVDVDTTHLKADGDTITTAALAEVNGNRPPAKVNGLKNTDVSADTNGYAPISENGQLGALTLALWNSNDNAAVDNTLIEGGVPQFLRGYFNIDGTNITEIVRDELRASEELSEMDDDQVNDLIADSDKAVGEAVPDVPVAKSKKGKNKKRR